MQIELREKTLHVHEESRSHLSAAADEIEVDVRNGPGNSPSREPRLTRVTKSYGDAICRCANCWEMLTSADTEVIQKPDPERRIHRHAVVDT